MKSLSEESLKNLLELDADTGGTLIQELIEAYYSEIPARVQGLLRSIEARDEQTVSSEAHGIKSSFANFGALQIAELLRQIEFASKGADWAAMSYAVAALPGAVAEFEQDLLSLKAHGSSTQT